MASAHWGTGPRTSRRGGSTRAWGIGRRTRWLADGWWDESVRTAGRHGPAGRAADRRPGQRDDRAGPVHRARRAERGGQVDATEAVQPARRSDLRHAVPGRRATRVAGRAGTAPTGGLGESASGDGGFDGLGGAA